MKVNAPRGVYVDLVRSAHTVQDSRQASGAAAAKSGVAAQSERTDEVTLSSDASLQYAQAHLESEVLKQVEEALEHAGLDLDDAMGMDWSPEAAAQRIFDFASGLFDAWREQHPDMDEAELIDSLEETIRSAVDEGYAQAMDILSGMELEESVIETADETMSVLHQMFDGFFSDLRANLEEAAV